MAGIKPVGAGPTAGPSTSSYKRASSLRTILSAALLAGCSGCSGGSATDVETLSGAASSMDELATMVLAGLAVADTAQLEQVRLTEMEHNELVWPELPAGQPEVNYPVDVAWRNIQSRNWRAVGRLINEFGDRELNLEEVECLGETQEFASFNVMTDCYVTFEVVTGGFERRQLFKDVLDWDGELKIFRYYDD